MSSAVTDDVLLLPVHSQMAVTFRHSDVTFVFRPSTFFSCFLGLQSMIRLSLLHWPLFSSFSSFSEQVKLCVSL